MTSPARRRAADRFAAVGVPGPAAAALAALAHPFDGASGEPSSQVRAAVQSEADAFRTASASMDDPETLLWLGTTIADRYVTTAATSGSEDLAAEFRAVRATMDAGIRSLRAGPLLPPVGPVTPSTDPTPLAWPTSGPAAAGAEPAPPPAWPGASATVSGGEPGRGRSRAVWVLLAVPLALLTLFGGLLIAARTGSIDGAIDAADEPTMAEEDPFGQAPFGDPEPFVPAPLPDLERASIAAFRPVLAPIGASEQAMGDFRVEIAETLEVVGDPTSPEVFEAVREATTRATATLEAAREDLEEQQAEFGDDAGDLAIVLEEYFAHQQAWIDVWARMRDEPELAVDPDAEPLDLFDDVNATAESFAPAFGAVVPRGLDAETAEQVFNILVGFGPLDLEEVFGTGIGETI